MNWKVGNKVFKTEKEAQEFCKALCSMGAWCGWAETDKPVTHIHLGDGMTREV